MKVNMHEAKTGLSRLVAALEAGEETEIEIARAGKTVARLVPPAPRGPRKPGRLAAKIRVSGNFEAPLPKEIGEAFGDKRN